VPYFHFSLSFSLIAPDSIFLYFPCLHFFSISLYFSFISSISFFVSFLPFSLFLSFSVPFLSYFLYLLLSCILFPSFVSVFFHCFLSSSFPSHFICSFLFLFQYFFLPSSLAMLSAAYCPTLCNFRPGITDSSSHLLYTVCALPSKLVARKLIYKDNDATRVRN
jgi:hypothetical protein